MENVTILNIYIITNVSSVDSIDLLKNFNTLSHNGAEVTPVCNAYYEDEFEWMNAIKWYNENKFIDI